MRLEDCFRRRLLRRETPNHLMSNKALDMAYEKLARAVDLKENGFFDEAVVASYSAMFQAARALLFNEGVMEKSHYCVVLYLRENHKKTLGMELIGWLDMYRTERHAWFYGIESMNVDEVEAGEAIERSNKFIDRISKLLLNKNV